ncbi:MAG: hypothetical protein JW834_01135 [Candidatus Diapherotrites archaeon]|nr:hypothetical protein [Candidatus Diapherotrites archaeon]
MKAEIVFNAQALDIACQPYLVGDELEEKALQSCKEFLETRAFKDPAELVILEGGKHYRLSDAYEAVHGQRPAHLEIDSKRKLDGKWTARLSRQNLSDLRSGQTIIIGDTIATGVSLEHVITYVIDYAKESNIDINKFVVFTIAGAKQGMERLRTLDADIEMYYSNAMFRLHENGTDLLWNGAEYEPSAMAQFFERLGGFAPYMKCAIWDWGDRFRNPQKHLQEIHGYYSGVDAPDWLVRGIEERMK